MLYFKEEGCGCLILGMVLQSRPNRFVGMQKVADKGQEKVEGGSGKFMSLTSLWSARSWRTSGTG